MKKTTLIITLLILPVILFIMSITYKISKGEYYLQGYYDPSYVYLISSLNLSQLNGSGVMHIDHPGAPVQVAGAVIIKVLHSIGSKETDLVKDVLSRPEFYLNSIFYVSNFIIAAALFVLGLVVYKKFHSVWLALLLQLTPFFSTNIYFTLTNIVPELFLIFILLIFITLIISFVREENMPEKKLLKYVFLFAVICGFGLATKISFFPILIIPVVLIRRISFKMFFLILSFIGFLIFVSPAISIEHSARFVVWIKNLITHSGRYGKGPENFIDIPEFFTNLRSMFIIEPLFAFSYLLLAGIMMGRLFSRFKNQIKKNKFYGLFVGIFIAMTVQIFIVAKHFALYYLIPSLMLSVPAIFVGNMIFAGVFPKYFGARRNMYLFLTLLIFSFFQFITIIQEIPGYAKINDESNAIINYFKGNHENSLVISSYGASGKETALYFGIEYAGKQPKVIYDSILKDMFPDRYYFNIWSNEHFGNSENAKSIKDKFLDSEILIFRCDKVEVLNSFLQEIKRLTNDQNINYKCIISNSRGESIYEIRSGP